MDRWRDRVALVTGGSSGIGHGVALRLASHGMKVATCARNFDALKELQETVKANGVGEILPIQCDLRNSSEITNMFEVIKKHYGRVDVCVNNAGLNYPGEVSLLDGSTEKWRDILNVNILAVMICSRESVKLMKENNIDDGQVIHISSMSGHRLVDNFVYSCTKHAVKALTEGLRVELFDSNSRIRVASVSPANVDTRMTSETFKQLDVSDIVDAVVYILSAQPHAQVHDVLIRSIEQKT